MKQKIMAVLLIAVMGSVQTVTAQQRPVPVSKKISPDLFGIFFEDISYAADGGLYAELIQNRSFEYSPTDRKGWHPLTAWDYLTDGFGYGNISVETGAPLHANNPHYITLTIEDQGQQGIGLKNGGFDGIPVRAGEKYDLSMFIKEIKGRGIPIQVKLQSKKGVVYGEASFTTNANQWKKYNATITVTQNDDSAQLVILAKTKGKIALDVVSLFPQRTFKNRPNGLRADLAQVIADLTPRFMRFPGGCLVHGDGLGNIYRWKNTVGPVEQRVEQKNIWNYHQTGGLGYFEYFQFCEDIGAKAVPVVAAAVSCQNSGGTWRIGGTGQKAIPQNEMQAYIQEILDLVEYANGPVTSKWGAKRAQAGHPQPFHLEYLGIGNEDKITPQFKERFKMIYDAVKKKYPEITLIGTAGPFHSGEDFTEGWKFINELKIPVVDEHYYENPEWFINNHFRYDSYDRKNAGVYLGEYASKGNTLFNALAEAAYMTSLERNGDVVRMASYAPLLARQDHTSWNPNLVYFTGTGIMLTANYYVQQLFSNNSGDRYFSNIVSVEKKNNTYDSLFAASCVQDTKTGDLIIKLVNIHPITKSVMIDFSGMGAVDPSATITVLTGDLKMKNAFNSNANIVPRVSPFSASEKFQYIVPAQCLTVIRIKTRR